MKKYVIDTVNPSDYTAGSKARNDIDQILSELGFQKESIVVGPDKKRVFKEIACIKRQLRNVFDGFEDDSVVVIQYPWPTMSYSFIGVMDANIRKIAIIHDLNSVRTGSRITRAYYNHVVREIDYLSHFDGIITHNDKMKEYLVGQGISPDKIVPLNLFDYLAKVSQHGAEDKLVLNIAGNLAEDKATYLYKLREQTGRCYTIHLYGPNYVEDDSLGVAYYGSKPAEELPAAIKDGFGLVWDGESIDGCNGHFGDYLKINNPHKLSLYMACGVPVFVWKQAAVAKFVENNHIGYAINSLDEIDKIMGGLSHNEYLNLRENVSRIQNRVIGGMYTREAVLSLMKACR